MGYTTLQNTPIEIDLVEQGKSTGWEVNGTHATHEVCNAGYMYLENYPLVSGKTYSFTYRVGSISGGLLRAYTGSTAGSAVTTTGFKTETLVASGSDLRLAFYSTADLEMEIFNIKEVSVDTSPKKRNAISWSERNNKWTDYRAFNPDCAYSLFDNLYCFKQGNSYVNNPQSGLRNEFFGVDYDTIVNVPFNSQPEQTKTFQGISLQNNLLMITTEDGITTSLGQISELIELDFLKDTLDDGVDTVNIYSKEGVYSCSFMKDKNDDIVNGADLKGNYITVELITAEPGILRLSTVAVHSEPSRIGVR